MHGVLQITFLSDTCFSSPSTQSASIDTDITVNSQGLPMVNGKTLQGLLRDTWLCSKESLDPSNDGYKLFGRTKSNAESALLHIGPGAFTGELAEWTNWALNRETNRVSAPKMRQAFTIERTLTSEDRESGRPRNESLRKLRAVAAGISLEAPVTTHTLLSKSQMELLDTLAKLTRHVGLHRNRGMGHVRMRFCWDIEEDKNLKFTGWEKIINTSDNVFFPLNFTLTSPCIISDKATDDNSRQSRDYIQGSAIRGAIAAALVRMKVPEDMLREILVSGKVRFLNAYPEELGIRSLPTNIAWQRVKDVGKEDYKDDAAPRSILPRLFDPKSDEEDDEGSQLQPLTAAFHIDRTGSYTQVKVEKHATVHQSRDSLTGHTSRGDSTVYVYESMNEGQTFAGCISMPANDEDLRKLIEESLQEPLWLGRSKRAGYGGNPVISIPSQWNILTETGKPPIEIQSGKRFNLLLTSDALFRDPSTGQHDPWLLEQNVCDIFKGMADVNGICVKASNIKGYNRLWGCELPSLPTASAGSTALLIATRNISSAELATLQSRPFGERTAEGLGCFILNPEPKVPNIRINKPASRSAANEPAKQAPEVVINAQRRLFQDALRLLVAEHALIKASEAKIIPSSSCLGRVRTILLSDNWQTTIRDWFIGDDSSKKLKSKAADQLENCHFRNESLTEHLIKASNGKLNLTFTDAGEAGLKEQSSIFGKELAEIIWDEEKKKLTRFYLEVLLNALTKQNKKDKT